MPVTMGLSTSLDGFIAGAGDSPEKPLGAGGDRPFEWFSNGDTPSRCYPSFLQQGLRAGLLDEMVIHLVPVVLGRGVRLLDGLEPGSADFELVGAVDAPGVTHLIYRAVK